jgi:hypothetical protein
MMRQVKETFGGLDILVLNASGGMESGMGEDYALVLNRDAQLNVLDAAVPLLLTVAHRLRHEPPGALHPHDADDARVRARRALKRAGEDALRERIPALTEEGSTSSSSPAT